jgi:hypothetical protein
MAENQRIFDLEEDYEEHIEQLTSNLAAASKRIDQLEQERDQLKSMLLNQNLAREIIQQILKLVNKGHTVSFEEDWGGNTITVFIDDKHSHCGVPDEDFSFEQLVYQLHELLLNGRGLSFIKLPQPEKMLNDNNEA